MQSRVLRTESSASFCAVFNTEHSDAGRYLMHKRQGKHGCVGSGQSTVDAVPAVSSDALLSAIED